MRCCKRKCCSLCLIIGGIAFTVALVVCVVMGTFDDLVQNEVQNVVDKNVQLKEGSEAFKNWKSPSSRVYMQYFMFNLINSNNVANGGKPKVEQLGPYSYREIRHNVPRYFNHSVHTIVYYSEKAYVFDPATSCAGCDPMVDKIHTINIPLLKISQLLAKGLKEFGSKLPPLVLPILKSKINEFLDNEKVFQKRSVHDLLWGYEDFILATLGNFTMLLKEQFKKHGFNLPVPQVNPIVQLQTNNSNTSAEIHTGVGDIDRLGQYVSWNNFRKLPWWHTKWANMINGTDASMFRPDIDQDDQLQTFVSDVCRSLYLKYYSTIKVRGIKLYKYFAPPELFTYTADVRAGFCEPNNLTCVPDGLLDISVCEPLNVPIVVSLPHFLYANKSVQEAVDGMHPNEDDHGTFVSVEPITGITMKASKRIQINVAVDSVDGIVQLEKLRKVYLPVLFVNESAVISEDDAEKFKKQVYLPKEIVYIGKFVLIGVGCLVMVIGLILLQIRKKSSGESSVQTHGTYYDNDDDARAPLTKAGQTYIT